MDFIYPSIVYTKTNMQCWVDSIAFFFSVEHVCPTSVLEGSYPACLPPPSQLTQMIGIVIRLLRACWWTDHCHKTLSSQSHSGNKFWLLQWCSSLVVDFNTFHVNGFIYHDCITKPQPWSRAKPIKTQHRIYYGAASWNSSIHLKTFGCILEC